MRARKGGKPALYAIPMIFWALFSFTLAYAHDNDLLKECGKYSAVNVGNGDDGYRVHNNIWNGSDKSQCIQVDPDIGAFRIVSASHDKSPYGAPASYSFIHKGCHWGACTYPDGEMAKQVGALLEAKSSWSTSHVVDGVYNVAYDIWFHSRPVPTGNPDSGEMMIWLAYKGRIQPVGEPIAYNVKIDGTNWNIWGGWNGRNNVITYVRVSNVFEVDNLNIKSFIADSVARNFIREEWYMVSVGAGFEIWQGGEGLASNAFTLQLQ